MQIWDLSCHPEDFSPKDLIPDNGRKILRFAQNDIWEVLVI